MISNSGHDENGKYSGGLAGDQTGKEWQIQEWYPRPWTVVLRHPDPEVRKRIAQKAREAANNDFIGYDQGDRYSYWRELKKVGYQPPMIKSACEADCSAGVAANVKAVGYELDYETLQGVSIYSYTGNLRKNLEKAGFKALTDSKYLTSPDYLLEGDILLYEGHHVATNLDDGSAQIVWYESAIETTGLTTTSELIVRKSPSTESSIVTTVKAGTEIFPKGKAKFNGKWWVKYSDLGWMSMSYLRGWIKENNRWWYLLGEGKYDYYKSIVVNIDGDIYAFDQDGWMITADRISSSGAICG